LPTSGQTTGIEFSKLSFEWALVNHHMTLGVDGLYYDLDEVKYHHLEKENIDVY